MMTKRERERENGKLIKLHSSSNSGGVVRLEKSTHLEGLDITEFERESVDGQKRVNIKIRYYKI